MTKRRIIPPIVAVVAAAATAAAIAVSASGQAAPTTIQLTGLDDNFKFIDVAPMGGERKPFSEGDSFAIGGRLLAGGKAAGTSNVVCTVTQPGRKGLSECTGTLVLADGGITFAGVSAVATNVDVFAVTGGTGSYVGATGTVTEREGKGDKIPLTVKLGS